METRSHRRSGPRRGADASSGSTGAAASASSSAPGSTPGSQPASAGSLGSSAPDGSLSDTILQAARGIMPLPLFGTNDRARALLSGQVNPLQSTTSATSGGGFTFDPLAPGSSARSAGLSSRSEVHTQIAADD